MIKLSQSDIVRHKRGGTYGLVSSVNDTHALIVWHLGDGMRTSYNHKLTTKVVEIMHRWADYGPFYGSGRHHLGCYLGFRSPGHLNRGQALSYWLDSFATDKSKGIRWDDEQVEPCPTCGTKEGTTILRNVITGQSLQDMQNNVGVARAALDFNYRATGRSAGIAMGWLSECIANPYMWHKAKDHVVNNKAPTEYMNSELQRLTRGLVDKLGWRGFEFHQTNGIRFCPIVKEVTTYEPKTVITSLR